MAKQQTTYFLGRSHQHLIGLVLAASLQAFISIICHGLGRQEPLRHQSEPQPWRQQLLRVLRHFRKRG